MPLPEPISELEFEERRHSWDLMSKLIRDRFQSTLQQNQQLQNRINFLESLAAKGSDGKLTRLAMVAKEQGATPGVRPIQVQMK